MSWAHRKKSSRLYINFLRNLRCVLRRVLYELKADAENLGHWIEAHGKSCANIGEPYISALWRIIFCCMTVLQNTRLIRLIPLALFQLSFRAALIAVEFYFIQ